MIDLPIVLAVLEAAVMLHDLVAEEVVMLHVLAQPGATCCSCRTCFATLFCSGSLMTRNTLCMQL